MLRTLKYPERSDDDAAVDDREHFDEVLDTLDEVLACARHNMSMWLNVMERVEQTRRLRAAGVPYSQMRDKLASAPTVIEVVTANQERLSQAAAAFRRATARQLHREGMSQADIARNFGVSRQRIAAILGSEPRHDEEDHEAAYVDHVRRECQPEVHTIAGDKCPSTTGQ